MTVRSRLSAAPVRASVRREKRRAAKTASFRDAAQVHALTALEALVWLTANAKSEAVRVSAANAVIDRAHGRPASGAKGFYDDDANAPTRLEVQWLDPKS